jgi:GT2 family glycosyltransferase
MSPDISVVIVSFNTRDLLKTCLRTLFQALAGITNEVFVVDNASVDGSPEMVAAEFPSVRLLANKVNRGFGAANNAALQLASGRYIVLLNSDAFPQPNAILRAMQHMDEDARVGLGGARLVGPSGSWQPSARMFPSLLNDFLMLSGLSARFPRSRFFGRADRTWADPEQSVDVDWVPGAFSIVKRAALDAVGLFDEAFFLYYEEVDFCKRLKRAGYAVRYYADVVVIHLGGESSKTINAQHFSESGAQLTSWRMRSALLYYRKHHGAKARLAKHLEGTWYFLRAGKNRISQSMNAEIKREGSAIANQLLNRAWYETQGGTMSPERPW